MMEKRRSNNKSYTVRPKQVNILNKFSTFGQLRTDFQNIDLKLENENLKNMIYVIERKNQILEEHCCLLKEKSLYFETRLRDMERNNLLDRKVSDKDEDIQESEKNDVQEEHEKKATSLKDYVSGVIFGVVLPKVGSIMSKIREKRHEIKDFINENDPEGSRRCPIPKVNIKEKFELIKVNLFRVVIVLGSLMILSGVSYAGYKVWKTRHQHTGYLVPSDDEDEDSTEELFRAPNTPRGKDNIIKTNSTDSFETPGISTDFKSILDTASNK